MKVTLPKESDLRSGLCEVDEETNDVYDRKFRDRLLPRAEQEMFISIVIMLLYLVSNDLDHEFPGKGLRKRFYDRWHGYIDALIEDKEARALAKQMAENYHPELA